MFDRCPDEQLVTDLVAAQSTPHVADADSAATDLIEQLMAWDRVAAWVESHRLETMRRFAAARVDADTDLSGVELPADAPPSARASLARLRANLGEEAGRFAGEEIALALNISPTSAHRQLRLAEDLHGVHRDLGEALELGQVSGFVASMVATATRKLPAHARALLDEAVTTDAVELPAGKAIDAARARVQECDEYAEDRARSAHDDRHVFFKPLEDGVAMIGSIMPAEDALRCWQRIDADARAANRAGAAETLDQLRCAALVRLLTGHADSMAAPIAEQQPTQHDVSPAGDGTASGAHDTPPGADPPVAERPTEPVHVQVVISLATLLGLDSKPAYLDGYGTITSTALRRIFEAGDVTLTRLLCDPISGGVMVADPTRYQPSDKLRHAAGCRDRHCRMPVCQARVRHLDHLQARVDAGLTTEENLQGLNERCHLTKHHPGWKVTGDASSVITWQTPTGHRYPSLPPPALGYGNGPPPEFDNPLELPDWLSRQQRLRAALDAHRRRTDAAWRQRGLDAAYPRRPLQAERLARSGPAVAWPGQSGREAQPDVDDAAEPFLVAASDGVSSQPPSK